MPAKNVDIDIPSCSPPSANGCHMMSAAARNPRRPYSGPALRTMLGLIGIAGLLLVWPVASPAAAQQPAPIIPGDTVMEVRLTDGSVLYGRIVATDGDRVTIVTESGGRIEVDRA